jgi:hypothetical protein
MSLDTLGGDVFAGYRISRWVSMEGCFAFHVATHTSFYDRAYGAPCPSGPGEGLDLWRTNVFGA